MKKYINGQYVEMTREEVEQLLEIEKANFYEEINRPLTFNEKVAMVIESIPTLEKPQPKASRPGYLWKQIYDAEQNVFGWEEIADPYYIPVANGSYTTPFVYENGMSVTTGLFYKFDDENIWECIKTGDNSEYTKEWFEIIEL